MSSYTFLKFKLFQMKRQRDDSSEQQPDAKRTRARPVSFQNLISLCRFLSHAGEEPCLRAALLSITTPSSNADVNEGNFSLLAEKLLVRGKLEKNSSPRELESVKKMHIVQHLLAVLDFVCHQLEQETAEIVHQLLSHIVSLKLSLLNAS